MARLDVKQPHRYWFFLFLSKIIFSLSLQKQKIKNDLSIAFGLLRMDVYDYYALGFPENDRENVLLCNNFTNRTRIFS